MSDENDGIYWNVHVCNRVVDRFDSPVNQTIGKMLPVFLIVLLVYLNGIVIGMKGVPVEVTELFYKTTQEIDKWDQLMQTSRVRDKEVCASFFSSMRSMMVGIEDSFDGVEWNADKIEDAKYEIYRIRGELLSFLKGIMKRYPRVLLGGRGSGRGVSHLKRGMKGLILTLFLLFVCSVPIDVSDTLIDKQQEESDLGDPNVDFMHHERLLGLRQEAINTAENYMETFNSIRNMLVDAEIHGVMDDASDYVSDIVEQVDKDLTNYRNASDTELDELKSKIDNANQVLAQFVDHVSKQYPDVMTVDQFFTENEEEKKSTRKPMRRRLMRFHLPLEIIYEAENENEMD
jgi:formiminotetrahydrofolate cyclodeaminase